MQRQFDDMCILTVEERARISLNVPTLGMKRSHVGNKTFPRWEQGANKGISNAYWPIRDTYCRIRNAYSACRRIGLKDFLVEIQWRVSGNLVKS